MVHIPSHESGRTADTLVQVAHLADQIDTADEADQLADIAEATAHRLLALAARLRSTADLLGGRQRCDSPPDLTGACLRCGRRIAPPVSAEHSPGCLTAIIPLHLSRRIAVRCVRLSRLVRQELGR